VSKLNIVLSVDQASRRIRTPQITTEVPRLTLTPSVIAQVASLLSREPRGLEEIAVAHPDGRPMVIRVASLVDDKPFPTLFWLIDPALCYRIDQVEAVGLIKQLQQKIDANPELQSSMRTDHLAHIELRQGYMTEPVEQRLGELNFENVFTSKGIGGIADLTRIRCQHTWYAAHLVLPNTVGGLLDAYWLDENE
jgi:hypothetical protein